MTPGRPPPTIVRRTAWEFAGLIVANSRGFLRLQTYSGRGARMAPSSSLPSAGLLLNSVSHSRLCIVPAGSGVLD